MISVAASSLHHKKMAARIRTLQMQPPALSTIVSVFQQPPEPFLPPLPAPPPPVVNPGIKSTRGYASGHHRLPVQTPALVEKQLKDLDEVAAEIMDQGEDKPSEQEVEEDTKRAPAAAAAARPPEALETKEESKVEEGEDEEKEEEEVKPVSKPSASARREMLRIREAFKDANGGDPTRLSVFARWDKPVGGAAANDTRTRVEREPERNKRVRASAAAAAGEETVGGAASFSTNYPSFPAGSQQLALYTFVITLVGQYASARSDNMWPDELRNSKALARAFPAYCTEDGKITRENTMDLLDQLITDASVASGIKVGFFQLKQLCPRTWVSDKTIVEIAADGPASVYFSEWCAANFSEVKSRQATAWKSMNGTKSVAETRRRVLAYFRERIA